MSKIGVRALLQKAQKWSDPIQLVDLVERQAEIVEHLHRGGAAGAEHAAARMLEGADEIEAVNAVGCVTVILVEAEQPFASVTVYE